MDQATFDATLNDRYFEDYLPGSIYEYGEIRVGEDDIIEFARQYDPQYFHTDRAAAESGPFKGLIASGWQTCSLMMRLYVDHYLSSIASLGAPGIDEVRWPTPVRPGDRLRLRVTVLEAIPSRSKPDRGVIRTKAELLNQDQQLAFSTIVPNILRRRQA